MPTHKGAGILIAFEGIDGAGKTTQAARLASLLEQSGDSVLSSKEPTNGAWGQKIRESAQNGRLSPKKELELFLKDREEHVSSVVAPGLEDGKIVILDRYYYSTLAYQGARGIPIDVLKEQMESRFPIPDAVFLLDIDPSLSVYRIAELRGESPNRFEKIENLRKVRKVFSSIRDKAVVPIEGCMSIETVHLTVVERFIDGPLKSRRCAKEYGCDDPFHCSFRLTNTCNWINDTQRIRQHLKQPVNQ